MTECPTLSASINKALFFLANQWLESDRVFLYNPMLNSTTRSSGEQNISHDDWVNGELL